MIYVLNVARTINVEWEDLEGIAVMNEVIFPCFPVDKASPESLETALGWAGYNKDLPQSSQNLPKQIERANDPFQIRIAGLEARGRGGRAYKVMTEEGYWFDLREDVLLDALILSGIEKGGKINGSFVWGKVGSQIKLVRVGSALHSALIEAGKRRTIAKVKHLSPGGIYRNVKGERFLVIGRVSTVEFTYDMGFTPKLWEKLHAIPASVCRKDYSNQLLVLQLQQSDKGLERLNGILDFEKSKSFYLSYFKRQNTLSVVECEDIVQLPIDLLPRLREAALRAIAELSEGHSGEIVVDRICYESGLANLVAYPEEPSVSAEFSPLVELLTPYLK
ncbi:MAG: hypothetical protein IAF58_02530 [Leptolyngbya sp.]|nr:hypothetical protein [Candidatus Melainabacteria bacterium]